MVVDVHTVERHCDGSIARSRGGGDCVFSQQDARGVFHRQFEDGQLVGEVIVARLLHPLPHLPHGYDGVDHHHRTDYHYHIAPQAAGYEGTTI